MFFGVFESNVGITFAKRDCKNCLWIFIMIFLVFIPNMTARYEKSFFVLYQSRRKFRFQSFVQDMDQPPEQQRLAQM